MDGVDGVDGVFWIPEQTSASIGIALDEEA